MADIYRYGNIPCFFALFVPTSNLSIKQRRQFRTLLHYHSPSSSKRRSHRNLFVNSSSSSSSDSVSFDVHLLSTTVCLDGSVLFRFGNVSEIQEKAPRDKVSSTHSYRVLGGEDTKKPVTKSGENVEIMIKIDESNVSRVDKYGNCTKNVSNVEEPDHKPTLNKQIFEDTAVDTEESEYLVPNNVSSTKREVFEQNWEMHDTSEEKSEAESGASSNSSKRESSGEVPTNDALRIITKDSDSIHSMNPSLASEDFSFDKVKVNVIDEDNDADDLTKLIPSSNSVKAEPVLHEDVGCNKIEEPVEATGAKILIMINEGTQSATSEIELSNSDTQNSIIRETSIPSLLQLEPIKPSPPRKEVSTAGLVLSSGATSRSHPSKALTGGGDAYFVSGQNWFGVADGIGQWSLEGGNAGLYAQELMENCEKIVSECDVALITNSREVLIRSSAQAQSPGLSTILVAYFDGQVLDVSNIGDSGFAIIRNGVVFKRSSPMVHELHFPMQIEKGDDPSELIESYQIDLDDGDAIILATDGLFDNLYEQAIASIVTKSVKTNLRPKEIAELLATRAQEVGRSASARSPFADAAQAAGYVGCTGGKLDDVTVIVSLVQKESPSE